MITRLLNRDEDFYSVVNWLNHSLLQLNSIIPIPSQVEIIPKSKGVYFWLMREEGYAALSSFSIVGKLPDCYVFDFNGVKYDLVYIGTAGTGKNGNSNLRERINWHISQIHTPGAVCHGTLSTFRLGIGAMVAEDLLLDNTERFINDLFESYFKIIFIPYDKICESNIENDEVILIKTLKPLFNLKNNPNAKYTSIDNFTKSYKNRRNQVNKNSKNRLGCSKKSLEEE
jgi:hypothetical protein